MVQSFLRDIKGLQVLVLGSEADFPNDTELVYFWFLLLELCKTQLALPNHFFFPTGETSSGSWELRVLHYCLQDRLLSAGAYSVNFVDRAFLLLLWKF